MVVAAVPTFADVPAADGNPVMEPAAAMAADENAVMEPTAVMEAIAAAIEAATAAMEATAAAMEANTAMETTTAMEATAATMAAAAPTAPGICRGRQNHSATQHGSTCGEFRYEIEVQHGCRNSTHPDAYSITFVRQRLFFTSIQCFGWSGR